MVKIIKKIIKNFLNKLGYEVRWHYPELTQMSFDEIYQKFFNKNKVIVFDVGANKGQSIDRFTKLFKEKKIHSFEPIKFEFLNLKKKYSKYQHVNLNNHALGEKTEKKRILCKSLHRILFVFKN